MWQGLEAKHEVGEIHERNQGQPRERAPSESSPNSVAAAFRSYQLHYSSSCVKNIYRLVECCLNWRVISGLALVGAALFLYAPELALAYFPVLLALICPISMLVMMLSMGRMNMGRSNEVAFPNLNRDERLQLLEARLERVQQQHRAIASELADAADSQTVAV